MSQKSGVNKQTLINEPAVYAWMRDGQYLYIGSTENMHKRISKTHSLIKHSKPGDQLRVWKVRVEDLDELVQMVESFFIEKLKPKLNQRVAYKGVKPTLEFLQRISEPETFDLEKVKPNARKPKRDVFAEFDTP